MRLRFGIVAFLGMSTFHISMSDALSNFATSPAFPFLLALK